MSSPGFMRIVLAIISLANVASCGILNQRDRPPSPEGQPPLPLTEQEQSRIREEINELFNKIARLEDTDDSDEPNPWELSGLQEGDILLEPDDRNMVLSRRNLWTRGIVPYYIEEEDFTDDEKFTLLQAMKEYHTKTCIEFRPYRNNDTNWIVFRSNGSGCWSSVGMRKAGQTVNLQTPGCIKRGVVIHELLHALGAYHMQSASNRDDYVRILWDNIKNGTQHNFNKYNENVVTDFSVGYDYESVMHYSRKAFSKNGEPTIEPLQTEARIGQRVGLSEKDIEKLTMEYRDECFSKRNSEPSVFNDQFQVALNAARNKSTVSEAAN